MKKPYMTKKKRAALVQLLCGIRDNTNGHAPFTNPWFDNAKARIALEVLTGEHDYGITNQQRDFTKRYT